MTGASRGIGRALALALADRGAHVVVAAKSVEETPGLPGTIFSVAAGARPVHPYRHRDQLCLGDSHSD